MPELTAGFAPISDESARVLILGTLPGQESLKRGEYYAKRQNAFWRVMGDLYGAGPDLPYAERTARLLAEGVALWDVCRAANRPGSLDAAIDAASVEANDFTTLHLPRLRVIAFNGATAAKLFQARVVGEKLPAWMKGARVAKLPSTSPAHAAMRYEEKVALWRAALVAE